MTMVCNAATIPVLYFILEKKTFAEWATALACLNLWCFPESARNLLITSGNHGHGDKRKSLTIKFLAAAGLCAVGTLLLHVVGWDHRGTDGQRFVGLIPLLILMLGIPIRFRIAELKGQLQATGQWKLQASLVSGANLLLGLAVIAAAWLSRNVNVIATVYVLMLLVQLVVFRRLMGDKRALPVLDSRVKSESTSFAAAMALSFGPLLFSQGDKIGLRFVLSETQLAEYAFYVAIAGQINVIGALPCIPLAAWFRRAPENREGLLRTAQLLNLVLVILSIIGIFVGFWFLKAKFPGLIYSKLSGSLLFCAVCIYGMISLNGPAYFLLIGQGRYKLVGWVNLGIAILSLCLIMILGRIYGIHGAVLGNVVFGLTVFWAFPAYNAVHAGKTGWLLGGFAALCLLMLSVLPLFFSF